MLIKVKAFVILVKITFQGNEVSVMKGKLFWASLLLISISWIVNAFYAQSKMLKEPIFLDHAIYKPVQHRDYLTFYYLTNANDDTSVSNVYFNGIYGYVIDDESSDPIQTFPHYALQKAMVELEVAFDYLQDGPLSNDEIQVTFSDGRGMTAPIGELTIYEYDTLDYTLSPKGGSGGGYWSMNWYEVEEDVTIEKIELNLSNHFAKYVTVKLNSPSIARAYDILNTGKETGIKLADLELPIALQEGENLYINWKFDPKLSGFIESSIVISGTTASGKPFTEESLLYSQQPYLENEDVLKIIEERENAK